MSHYNIPRVQLDEFVDWLTSTGWQVKDRPWGKLVNKSGYLQLRLFYKTDIANGVSFSQEHKDLYKGWQSYSSSNKGSII